jgi:adenosylmethionine-8-amino-7-oxononanoate aminotransferase
MDDARRFLRRENPAMNHVLLKFPNRTPRPYAVRTEGLYIHLEDGRRLLDMTSGWTHHAVVGYSNPEVLEAMRRQMERFTHLDYDMFRNRTHDELAEIIVSQAPPGLNLVYFCGSGGSEATEAALKLSYQVHWDMGKKTKSWIISRDQSYHGATLQAMSVWECDILDFYEPLFPERRARIPIHHPLYFKRADESLDDYARRSAGDLERKILELGPENVGAFIAETQLGALIGDVPPAPHYWRYVREICDRYDVHLILDEVYVGLGRSGKIYCCSWDGVTPDFVVLGKTLAAGYTPLSAVVTSDRFLKAIAAGQGRVQHGHTHQGHSLGAAAALAVQKIIHRPETLEHIGKVASHMQARLNEGLGSHPFFRDLRGRGLAFSLEYDCPRKPEFGAALAQIMEDKHGVLMDAKWHRVSVSCAYTITMEQADYAIDTFTESFRDLAARWSD